MALQELEDRWEQLSKELSCRVSELEEEKRQLQGICAELEAKLDVDQEEDRVAFWGLRGQERWTSERLLESIELYMREL